jgi:hypothetical protein
MPEPDAFDVGLSEDWSWGMRPNAELCLILQGPSSGKESSQAWCHIALCTGF